jgi:hypothetical protein
VEANEAAPGSVCSLSFLSGTSVAAWSTTETVPEVGYQWKLQIAPDRPLIIGRAEGGQVPYLDPAYRPTTVLPGTGQTVLQDGGAGTDLVVSRGHLMIHTAAGGLWLVNGVPRRGGGIRPPVNGTWLLAPVRRRMEPGEPYLIETGSAVDVWLRRVEYLPFETMAWPDASTPTSRKGPVPVLLPFVPNDGSNAPSGVRRSTTPRLKYESEIRLLPPLSVPPIVIEPPAPTINSCES